MADSYVKEGTSSSLPVRRGIFLLSGFFFLLFLSLVGLLMLHLTVRPDRLLSEFFLGLPSSFYWAFSILCRSGNVEIELPIFLVIGGVLWRKKKAEHPVFLYFFVVFVVGTVLEHYLKMSLPRYSPSKEFQHDPLTGWEILHFPVVSSFPSGHTFRALLIFLFVDRYLPRFRFGALVWAALIMIGVVALGWHWSSDVVGSAFLVLAIRPWIDALGQNKRDLIG